MKRRSLITTRNRGRFAPIQEIEKNPSLVIGVRVPTDIQQEFRALDEESKGGVLDLLREYIELCVDNLPDEWEVNRDFPATIELTEETTRVIGVRVPTEVKHRFSSLERWQRSRILEGTRSFIIHLLVTDGVDEAGYIEGRRLPKTGEADY